MKIPNLISFAMVLALMFFSCSKTTPEESMQSVRNAMEKQDYAAAQKYLDNAVKDSVSHTATNLSEMAVLYMKLSENYNNEENVASAFSCYEKAMNISSDSVMSYIANIPVDERACMLVLHQMNVGAEGSNFDEGWSEFEEEGMSAGEVDEHSEP